jgi:hypothetical protein
MSARLFVSVFSLACMQAHASPNLESWIAANAGSGEQVICRKESKGEYFFVARAGDSDKLRLASRVDLSAYRPPHLSFSVAWILRNEQGRSITAKITPTVIKQQYLRQADQGFAENVKYQTINIGWSKQLRVAVRIEKCPSHSCAEGSLRAMRYTVDICEAPL